MMLHMLFTILFLEGFITISVEILTIRQLIPFFGSSVVITSVIIGVFLLFLALGYWRGGVSRAPVFQQLRHNFTYALIWIGCGLNYPLIATFFYVSTLYLKTHFLLSLSLYLLIVLAPIVYWLGQTIPLTTNLFNKELRVSHISGRALFISTLGSFLGALVTSLLLFQYIGVAWTVVINCMILFVLVLCLGWYHPSSKWSVVCLSLTLLFITLLNVSIEKQSLIKANNYANYHVYKLADGSQLLNINQSTSSLLTKEKKGFTYIEVIRHLLFTQLNLRHKHLLVIGAGGFTLTARGSHGNDVTYVDIDPEIKHLTETYFLNATIQGHFVGQDARAYLQQHHQQFDVIISDAYSNRFAIPPSLLTAEYFQSLANHLHESGLLIINIIHDPLFADQYSRHVFNTIHAVFPHCTTIPINWQRSTLVNMLYVCPKITTDRTVYSDNLNTITSDFFNHIAS
ncbi:MAG: fused MFS/spermidine synthase [Gammaproteobacteria bacterium]|nr:fused MFS/spermidine synthase [Gammaproteobacteria bacterium]